MASGGTFKKWVLYVNNSKASPSDLCPGSKLCMAEIKSIQEDVHVQNISRLLEKGVPLPEWLEGSPIVVNTESKQAYKGTAALEFLRAMTTRPAASAQVEGIAPGGQQHYLFDEDDSVQSAPPPRHPTDRDRKLTEQDVQAFIAQRNQADKAKRGPG